MGEGSAAVPDARIGGRLAHFLVQFANVVLSQKPLRAAAGALAGRPARGGVFITG
ncbi:acyl-CoA hydrolase [Burkholderia sp. AU27893]|uniref:Acyl-CoA hydrolase n=1 Tax=Burkholderia contaminans TaxID=488447 RepID=A0A2S5DVL7_9BURK|nr:acyl-CoA hydrolase [Burkholderia sp. AU27893]OXJ00358.1 acyl-CoA hydrolase [Burkholderia sp. AU33803]POZ83126.1 acyl-CoA hydrolase [Burkholderia contaminans]PRD87508.1 acyl-CoA hydrolase [Burkholderia contaminans]